jgi:beta-propeller uncharacterized protein DUF5122
VHERSPRATERFHCRVARIHSRGHTLIEWKRGEERGAFRNEERGAFWNDAAAGPVLYHRRMAGHSVLSGRGTIRAWRLALLLALGGTVLFASFSYDEWVLIYSYLRRFGPWQEWRQVSYEKRQRVQAAQAREDAERHEREERQAAKIRGSIRELFNGPVLAVAALPDGGLLAGGWHSQHGLALARLRSDGSLDQGFLDRVSSGDVTGGVRAIVLERDGRIALGGEFSARRQPRVDLRALGLHADGTVDEGFLERALRG